MVYWAAGRIADILEDQTRPEHYFARIEDFLPFPNPVPLQRADGGYWERKLTRPDGRPSRGAMGWSIRRIPDWEFEVILRAGYGPAIGETNQHKVVDELVVAEDQTEFERPIVERLSQRPFRDRVFAQRVQDAYEKRCAVTGLQIINGGGRAEMEAAHIRPVAQNGPDTVRNGLALSRTVHWMFDRGLLSVDDDFQLLKAKPLLPEGVERLFDPSGYVRVPEEARDRPSTAFLRWHRENCFKG